MQMHAQIYKEKYGQWTGLSVIKFWIDKALKNDDLQKARIALSITFRVSFYFLVSTATTKTLY